MYKNVPLDALAEHPQRSNRISRSYTRKLLHNINRTGQYETLTVRPHPGEKGKYEVLNGHARLAALRDMDVPSAKCDIWEVNNAQAELFLAVLNKLHGSEVPELRMDLLLGLLENHTIEELNAHVPESKAYLTRLSTLPGKAQEPVEGETDTCSVIIVSFYLSPSERDILNRALEHIIQTNKSADSSRALVKMAELYLESSESHDTIQTAF